jgi:hypothetical protein
VVRCTIGSREVPWERKPVIRDDYGGGGGGGGDGDDDDDTTGIAQSV